MIFQPRPAQQLLLDLLQEHRFLTAVCHRRLGKTLTAVYWLLIKALTYKPAPPLSIPASQYRSFYFSPTQKQAKMISWQYFKDLLEGLLQQHPAYYKEVKFSETELHVTLPEGQRVVLAGSENIEFYRGTAINDIVLDELASWRNPYYAYFEVLRPAMADRQANGLFIGTPKTLDLFFDFFQYGQSNDPAFQDYASIKLPASLTKIIPRTELDQLKKTMSPDAYAREMECDFFSEAPDILISPSEIQAASPPARVLTPAQTQYSRSLPPVFGIDPGRNVDPTVVMSRQGLILHPPLLFTYNSNAMENADRIFRLIAIHKPSHVFIDIAKGGGLTDRLRQLVSAAPSTSTTEIIEVAFNERSPETTAYNMRAAMFTRLKAWLQKGQLPPKELFNDPARNVDESLYHEFRKELTNILLDQNNPDNKIKIQRKSKIIEAIGHSPNLLDAAGLTFVEYDTTMGDTAEDPEFQTQLTLNRLSQLLSLKLNMPDKTDPYQNFDPFLFDNAYDIDGILKF